MKDHFTYDYWMNEDINEADMKRFIRSKILWNMGKINQSEDEINRLIAFQFATRDKGLTKLFVKCEKEVIEELKEENLR